MKTKKGDMVQGASLSIFNTGRIRMSGGYLTSNPKKVLNYILPGTNIPISINNVTSEIKLAAKIKLNTLYNILDVTKGLATFQGYDLVATFEPERNKFITKQKKNSPFLYIEFGDEFTIVMSPSGGVIIEGAKDIKKATEVTRNFIEALKSSGLLTPTKRVVAIKPKTSKVAKRANKLPAPEVTRRGTSCPVDRRPKPYSYQGACPKAGHYIKPNPQGQPCCYKIPRDIEYSVNKVQAAYNKANVRVPDTVRKVFGFGKNTDKKKANVGQEAPDLKMFVDPKAGFKIGTRQCSRYSKVALVDIATRLKIPLPKKVTKPILCDILLKKAQTNK